MWTPVRRDPRDLAFLRTRGIELERVNKTFFKYAPDWRCPVCSAAKHALIHRRRNGDWFSGIEDHHYGSESSADVTRYLTLNKTVAVCYLCNDLEKTMRKLGLVDALMSVETMRASEEFMRRRREMKVRDTYGTPDPKKKWNVDGTRR
jgi:hypothetical protein